MGDVRKSLGGNGKAEVGNQMCGVRLLYQTALEQKLTKVPKEAEKEDEGGGGRMEDAIGH